MTPLVIDDKVIADLKKFAEEHPLDIEESKKIMLGDAPPPGEREGYFVLLPPCWKLVFSHSEYQKMDKPGTIWVRHMSMSLNRPGRLPNPIAIQMLSEQLGFPSLDLCKVTINDGIVEVVAPLNGKF